MSRLIEVAAINESTVVSDAELSAIIAAAQKQVYHDFRPTWGVTAELVLVPKGQTPPAGHFWLVVLDDADQAGALGYHDLSAEGLPLGKVFGRTDLKFGAKTSITFTHELLEMLGDPFINLTALDPETSRLYAYESADAVEADNLGYQIDGIWVTDFVLPQFFDPQHKGKGIPLSHMGHLNEPFSLMPGGYLSYLDLHNLNAGWQQMQARTAPEVGARAEGFPDGSRRERRRRAASGHLILSEPKFGD